MRSTILIIAALVASVVAIPAPADKKTTSTTSSKTTSSTSSAPTCKNPTSQNANFDDVTAIPGTTGNTIPVPYKGLYFQGFSVSSTINTGLGQPGVFPHSPANYAASSARTTITSGSAEFTTVYPNSNVKSFDLYSLYYGCVLSAGNGAAAVPTPCNIAVTGYATGDNTASTVQVASQEFSYNPSTMTGSQQQTMVTFSSAFKNLQYVLVQYTLPGGTAVASADLTILFDDIMYRTCSI